MKNSIISKTLLSNLFYMLVCILALSLGAAQQSSAEPNPAALIEDDASHGGFQLGEAVVTKHDGLFILDYQNIQLPKNEEIDLIGYHILSPVNDWAYFGFGGYAPFLKGDFGGFMAFGVIAHAQIDLTDNIFATAGLSFGGGGGGAFDLDAPARHPADHSRACPLAGCAGGDLLLG